VLPGVSLFSLTREKKEMRETSPFAVEIGDPAQFLNNLTGFGAANKKKKRDLHRSMQSASMKTDSNNFGTDIAALVQTVRTGSRPCTPADRHTGDT
jgi:hypothetical protein